MMLVLYEAEPGTVAPPAMDESTPEELAEVTDTFGAIAPDEGGAS